MEGRKPQILWPKSSQKREWEIIDSDLVLLLEQQKDPVERKLENMGSIIYSCGAERWRRLCEIGISTWAQWYTPGVLKYLWKLMKVAWQKGVILKAWRRAGGILIPKEKDSSSISQISLLNVEGKIFSSVLDQRLSTFLQRNNFVDTSVQKGFRDPGFLR
eukprot:superscaffoldBa00015303_g26567